MRLFPCRAHTLVGETEIQASHGVFRDVLGKLDNSFHLGPKLQGGQGRPHKDGDI